MSADLQTVGREFALELQTPANKAKLRAYIPDDKDYDRFTAVVLRAITENPDLLAENVDRRSLMLSCQRAAQDRLLPDGREGVFVVYNTKDNKTQQWRGIVQWQPMVTGLRKILARHGFSLDAQVVKEHDFWDWQLGDDPYIKHKPPPLGEPRGRTLAAYAVATGPDGQKYRDVMEAEDLEKVKAMSKQPGGAWTKWRSEMDRKSAAKRLFKQLPIDDEAFHEMLSRDNEQFDLHKPLEPTSAAREMQQAARKQAALPDKSNDPETHVPQQRVEDLEPVDVGNDDWPADTATTEDPIEADF